MINDFSHIQMLNYTIQVGSTVTEKVGIFNCNKLPTGVAVKCIETESYNPYLLTMTREHFEALFLDDKSIDDMKEVQDENN